MPFDEHLLMPSANKRPAIMILATGGTIAGAAAAVVLRILSEGRGYTEWHL